MPMHALHSLYSREWKLNVSLLDCSGGGLSLVAMAIGGKLAAFLALVCLLVGGSEGSYNSGGGQPATPSGSSSSPTPDVTTPTPDTATAPPPYSGTSSIPTPDTSSPSTPYPSTPTPAESSPSINLPPVNIPDSSTPVTYTPTPFGGFVFRPKRSGRGTYKFWRSHRIRFPNIFSIFTTLTKIFGGISSSRFGPKFTIVDALSNESNDGYSALARHGVASLLNSYMVSDFIYSPEQVRDQFNEALATPEYAAQQALLFERANELI